MSQVVPSLPVPSLPYLPYLPSLPGARHVRCIGYERLYLFLVDRFELGRAEPWHEIADKMRFGSFRSKCPGRPRITWDLSA